MLLECFTFTFTYYIYPIVMDRRAATGVLATNSLHSSQLSIFLKVSLSSNPIHSLILSSHLFFCLPLFLPPITVPCSMVFASPDGLVTCPYHFSFWCLRGMLAMLECSVSIKCNDGSGLVIIVFCYKICK